tara:strand:+ start:1201 stop:2847 length:1647 start_codon:yes stop_codon:yes gene_type:complete
MAKKSKNYTIEELQQMKSTLESDRNLLMTTYDDCLFYYLPEFQNESEYKKGTKVNEESQPLESHGQTAASTLSSGIFSNTVSMSSEFFGFRTNSEELNQSDTVRRWFAEAAKICLRQMQNSNFAMSCNEAIVWYTSLNTGVLYCEYSGDSMMYQSYPITQCSISEDKNGIVNTLFRSFNMTAQQAMERWGNSNSKQIKEAYNDPSARFQKFPFYHAVMPRDNFDREKMTKDEMPFYSYYCDEQNGIIVEDGGYKTFPYAVPRYERTSISPYGRGPSFTCLPLCREIDRLSFTVGDGIELKANPPSFFPAGTVQEDVDLLPGAVNFYNPAQGNIVFYQQDIDLQGAEARIFRLNEQIRGVFHSDLFRLPEDTSNMTATEVNARRAEKVQAITPVVNRLYDELFSVIITRTLFLLVDNGVIEPYPAELQGKDFNVEYTTKLDSMMKAVEVESVMRSIQQAAGIYETAMNIPKLNSVINIDQAVKNIFIANNVSNDVVYSDQETEDIQKQEAEAQAQAQQQQQMMEKMGTVDPMKAPEEGSIAQQMEGMEL